MGSPRGDRPIVIIGVSRRSGTNFLASVLLCHCDCAAPAPPVVEDHLLRDAPLLERYAQRTARHWPRRWGDREEARSALIRSLGAGLGSFLRSRTDGVRVVTRTPHTDNLHLAPQLFADADLVLLVRDGRSVAASLVHGWRRSHDDAIKEWRKGARDIIQFTQSANADRRRCVVVRYEDLVNDLDNAIDAVFDFTGLDPQRFDRIKAANLPIVGSSYIRDASGQLTWKPVDRPSDFQPAARFAAWSSAQHERFNWLAGEEQRALGYPLKRVDGARLARVARNTVRDVAGPVRDRPLIVARGVVSRLRGRRADYRWHASQRQT
jgi:hypothetical protein